MKKSYLMIAAALMASCSNSTKLDNEIPQANQNDKIGFVTYSEKATRTDETNSVNLYDYYKTFDVYAWKTAAGEEQRVFNHVPVEHFTSDTQGDVVYATAPAKPSDEWGALTDTRFHGWFYESIRYWDKLATSYNFYAIAPYEVTPSPALHIANGQNNITIGADDDRYMISTEKNLAINPTITNEKKYFGFNKDYMLADKSSTKFQLVTLNFHHILTKLNVKITLTDSYIGSQTFTIRDLKIAGLENEAYFEYSTNMTTNGWNTKTGSTYDLHIPTDYILKNAPATEEDKTEYSGYYWIQTLIFPQTLTCSAVGAKTTAPTGRYLYIEYTIGGETFKAYYDLAYVFDTTLAINGTYNLEQGNEYTININVGPEPIIFETTAAKWADEIVINHNIN